MPAPRLVILGAPDLRGPDDEPITSVLQQPRRLALLAYVALESTRGGVSRDSLIGVFWPEWSEHRARQALRQSLHFLRQSLGNRVIEGRGQLTFNSESLWCDAVEFVNARETGELRSAVSLYRGDFLTGLYFGGSTTQFEEWVDSRRLAFRRDAAKAAWDLAVSHEEAGDFASAGAMARRSAELLQADEPALNRTLELLGRIGDLAGAVEAYDTFSAWLQESLETSPSEEAQQLIAKIRKRRATIGITHLEDVPSPQRPVEDRESETQLLKSQPNRLAWRGGASKLVASTLMTLAFLSLWAVVHAPVPDQDTQFDASVGVEPISYYGARSAGGLADAITTELIASLSRYPALEVFPLSGRESEKASGHTLAVKPAHILRVALVDRGEVYRVSAVLIDKRTGAAVDRLMVEVASESAPAHEIAAQISDFARSAIGGVLRLVAGVGVSQEAIRLTTVAENDVLRGDSLRRRHLFSAANVSYKAADSTLQAASVLEPTWVVPLVRRAELSYSWMWLNLLSPTADQRAVRDQIRDGLDFANRALAVAPRNPDALEWRGLLRHWHWLTAPVDSLSALQSVRALAEADLRATIGLDHERPRAWSTLSSILLYQGEFEEAYRAADQAYFRDPFLTSTGEILSTLVETAIEIGDLDAAGHWCDEIKRRNAGSWSAAYCRLTIWASDSATADGRLSTLWPTIADGLKNSATAALARPRLEMLAAVTLANAGQVDSAVAVAKRAAAQGEGDIELLPRECRSRRNGHGASGKGCGRGPSAWSPSSASSRGGSARRES